MSSVQPAVKSGADDLPSSRPISVEQRSIEYIPVDERHGRPWHVTPIWFTSTSNLAALPVGALGVLSGLGLTWSLVAVVVGTAFGTFFASFHASQGPQLGMPQLIQSRPQYGYRGAVLIYLVAIVSYIGFSVFGLVLMGQAFNLLLGWPITLGMLISVVVAVIVAAVGYDVVHKLARWTAVAFLLAFLVMTVLAPTALTFPNGTSGTFNWTPFLVQASACAAASLAWAPYVSDYTRYLPHMSLKSSFFSTYIGMAVAAIWIEAVAAVVVSAFPNEDTVTAFRDAGDSVFTGFGAILLVLGLIGTLYLVAMDSYGGSLTAITMMDSFRPGHTGTALRVSLSVVMGGVAFLVALLASDSLLADYGTFLVILLYFLAPWTATNLVDFFFVRRGHYSIREIFNPTGMYGSWNWRGYAAYAIALVSMVPFVSTAWWSGPVAQAWGVDVAPYVGMLVSAGVYLIASRGLDLDGERARIRTADAGLAKVHN